MQEDHNLEVAVQNVKRNKGSAGVDGMEVDGIGGYMEDNWARIEEQILARTYKPKPVCVLSRENPQIIMRNSPVLSSPYQEWEKRVIFIPPFAYS